MSKAYSYIIIEDEEVSRDIIKNYVEKYCTDLTYLGEASNIQDGQKLIEKHNPDLVFLDIEMPYGNGFDLLENLSDINFEVIFITAYSHYAIQALNLSAAYYLLKPLDIDELVIAVDKVKESIDSKDAISTTKILADNVKAIGNKSKKIVLPQLDGFLVIPIATIVRLEASDNYTIVHLEEGKKHMVSKTLKHFDELLTDCGFMRSHKSHLINLDHIVQYKKGKTGQVIMSDNSYALVSPSMKKELVQYFS